MTGRPLLYLCYKYKMIVFCLSYSLLALKCRICQFVKLQVSPSLPSHLLLPILRLRFKCNVMYTCNEWWTRRGNSRFGINGGEIDRTCEILLLKLAITVSPAPHYTATAQPAAGLGQARVSSTANRDNKSQGKYVFFRNLISMDTNKQNYRMICSKNSYELVSVSG